MPSLSLESALVRILRLEGELLRPVGAGFLVSPQHIITCAHVVNSAFRLPKNAAEQANAEILVDFPLLNSRPLVRAKILHWFSMQENSSVGELEDIAVLELLPDTSLPDEARPAPVVLPHEQAFFDKRVRLCGFPVGANNGTYANGVLQGLNGKGWVEIHHQGSEQIEAGFSGTAVWSAEENAAFGMTVSILHRQNARVAYMIPAVQLIKAFPELDQHSRPANPYRGLESFREEDARFYFGRESDADALREKVEQQSFTAVIGASGSGKSSLVLAGVIPALRRTGDWLIADCRPKKQPFYELAACLVPLLYDDELELIKRTRQCAADLRTGELSLSDVIRRIVQKNGAQRFLLLVDQFEELYTLNDNKTARNVINQLLKAKNIETLRIVITVRADFLETALRYDVFAEILNTASIIVPPAKKEGMQKAVENPAAMLGVIFEPGLANLIVADVVNEPGNLPLLEFYLTQLWEQQEYRQITHNTYARSGGIRRSLAKHADAVYVKFTKQEQEHLRHIFFELVRPGEGTEDTRQVATVGKVSKEYRKLITKLADKRLIVTGRNEECGEETMELVHESLIRHWQILQQWVNDERRFLVWKKRLRVFQEQWEEKGEGALLRDLLLDEALKWRRSHAEYLGKEELKFVRASEQLWKRKRQKRKAARKEKDRQRKKNIGALVFGLIVMVVLLLMTVYQWQEAKRNARVAVQERHQTLEQKKIAEEKIIEAQKQTLKANYYLAKAFEEKALTALKAAEGQGDVEYKKAILFSSAALEQKIPTDEFALKASSTGPLFAPQILNASLAELAVLIGHEGTVKSATFSPDGKTVVSASGDKTVRLWDTANCRQLTLLKGHEGLVKSATFSPDGKTVVSASKDMTVRLWDADSGKQKAVLRGHKNEVNSAAFSPDGKTVISASDDKTVRLWDAASGRQLAVLKGHEGWVFNAAFSPDGKTVVSASGDKTVRLWDAASGRQLAVFKEHKGWVFNAVFSPDGKTVVSASGDKTVRLWDAASGRQLAVFKGHDGWVFSAVFSSSGKTVVSASKDMTVRLWDADSGKQKAVLRGHEKNVNNATFSLDGKIIASVSTDKIVRIWDMRLIPLFLHNSKPTPLYHTFIEAVKFLWQLDVQGLEIVETKHRTPADLKKYGTLLAPPPPGQSKFDQVLEWAEKQQGK